MNYPAFGVEVMYQVPSLQECGAETIAAFHRLSTLFGFWAYSLKFRLSLGALVQSQVLEPGN
jgi:hypothetical protein